MIPTSGNEVGARGTTARLHRKRGRGTATPKRQPLAIEEERTTTLFGCGLGGEENYFLPFDSEGERGGESPGVELHHAGGIDISTSRAPTNRSGGR